MKILFISTFFPDPNGRGVERRGWAHVEALSQLGQMQVVVTKNELLAPMQEELDKVRAVCPATDMAFFTQPSSPGQVGKIMDTVFRGRPEERRLSEIGRPELAHLEGQSFDVVFCFRIRSYAMWLDMRRKMNLTADRVIVDFDDIDSKAMARLIRIGGKAYGRLTCMLMTIDSWHLRRFENIVLRDADDVLVCSEVDRRELAGRGAKARLHAVPNTVPVPDLLPQAKAEPHHIALVGNMGFAPNVDAAEYLVRHILPHVSARWDDVSCSLVGFDPHQRVRDLAETRGVIVTGGVDDLAPYYQRAAIAVVPIRFGGGTRTKILEAMAYGRPVVSTTIGAEGLEITDGEDILIADTPEDFAGAVGRLFDDRDLWNRLVANGRRLVEERYSKEAAKRALQTVLDAG